MLHDDRIMLTNLQTPYSISRWLVSKIGATASELEKPWVRGLCTVNGILALFQYIRQYQEKNKFPTPSGERKVASFNVMNQKYVGALRIILFAHIVSGMTAQLGSSLAIFLEDYTPRVSRRLSQISSMAEAFVHAPTALILSPFVYGDKGVVPYLYGTVSFLLQISGLTALEESFSDEAKKNVELRRMCTTISIFLYVRLYGVMRGIGGFLRRQKYSMAVMTAGATMMPVGWSRGIFPSIFWLLFFINRKTVGETAEFVHEFGADETAQRQEYLA